MKYNLVSMVLPLYKMKTDQIKMNETNPEWILLRQTCNKFNILKLSFISNLPNFVRQKIMTALRSSADLCYVMETYFKLYSNLGHWVLVAGEPLLQSWMISTNATNDIKQSILQGYYWFKLFLYSPSTSHSRRSRPLCSGINLSKWAQINHAIHSVIMFWH